MSSVGNPGNVSGGKYTSAPDKGSFPLDRLMKCKIEMQDYMSCLKSNKQFTENCRNLSARYLQCRMNNNLMDHEEMSTLGFNGEFTEKKE